VINIGRSPLDRTLVNDLSTTVAEIFPSIFIMDLPDSFNSVLFATKQPGSWEDFALNYNMLFDKEADQLLLVGDGNDNLVPAATCLSDPSLY